MFAVLFALAAVLALFTHLHVQVLELLLEPVHSHLDALQVVALHRLLQGSGDACHVLGHHVHLHLRVQPVSAQVQFDGCFCRP